MLAEANTSAGAPWVIWWPEPSCGPKLKTTVTPGWAASNCLPSVVNASCSDAAANTLTVPVIAAVVDSPADDGEVVPGVVPELHAGQRRRPTATASGDARVRAVDGFS